MRLTINVTLPNGRRCRVPLDRIECTDDDFESDMDMAEKFGDSRTLVRFGDGLEGYVSGLDRTLACSSVVDLPPGSRLFHASTDGIVSEPALAAVHHGIGLSAVITPADAIFVEWGENFMHALFVPPGAIYAGSDMRNLRPGDTPEFAVTEIFADLQRYLEKPRPVPTVVK